MPDPEPPLKMIPSLVFQERMDSMSSSTLRMKHADACSEPTHLSNVHAREEFRQRSLLSAVCLGVVGGFGKHSYVVALDGLLRHLDG
jgi:hypothetical protein